MVTRRFGESQPPGTRGVVFVHSAPAALCPHIEWAIGSVLGSQAHVDWTNQPAQRGTLRAEISWADAAGTGAALASKLAAMQRVRFEVTEEPTTGTEGHRYAWTPTLGMFTATIGVHGDIMVNEERIKRAVAEDALGRTGLHDALAALLGSDWDAELDIFRHASEDAPVRWLHQVV